MASDNEHAIFKLAKNIAALVGCFWLIVQVIVWALSLKSNLTATIEANEFSYPPTLFSFLDAAKARRSVVLSETNIYRILAQSRKDTNDIAATSHHVSSELRYELDDYLGISDTRSLINLHDRRLNGVYHITVRNSGSTSFKTVSLRIPHAVVAQIDTENGSTNFQAQSDNIPIGDLSPKETLHVTVWTDLYSSGYFDEGEFLLRHLDGLGTISFNSEVGGPWAWMARYWEILKVPILLLSIYLIGLLWISTSKYRQKPTTSPTMLSTAIGPDSSSPKQE